VLAGVVLIAEAGGTLTTVGGGAFDPFRADICASNGRVHRELLGVLTSPER
jgi:myo-inositol-1(or 4)-monophosphatase